MKIKNINSKGELIDLKKVTLSKALSVDILKLIYK